MDLFGERSPLHGHQTDEWAEVLARTVAHLAAQLTITQLRLRALATELDSAGAVDRQAVSNRLAALARLEAGNYLRENLGEALIAVIDVEALSADIEGYLAEAGG